MERMPEWNQTELLNEWMDEFMYANNAWANELMNGMNEQKPVNSWNERHEPMHEHMHEMDIQIGEWINDWMIELEISFDWVAGIFHQVKGENINLMQHEPWSFTHAYYTCGFLW